MKLTSRFAIGFIELKVDTIYETIHKESITEIDNLIENLQNVIDDLNKLKQLNK